MRLWAVLTVAALLVVAAPSAAQQRPATLARGALGIVVTESPAASRVARAVLEDDGTAADAAAAAVFALGVARPQSCGIGGGGFAVVRTPAGRAEALDFRETAPAQVKADTFVAPGLHKQFSGHLTVGVPGVVAGMDELLDRYGTRTLAEVVAPAERLARTGVRVTTSFSGALKANEQRIALFGETARVFPQLAPGATYRNPDLAATYRRIARGGRDAFYRGTIARRIVRDMQAPRPATQDAGLIGLPDLAAYRAVWRRPVIGTYRGQTVIGMPPPTSGGVAVQEMLNVLEGYDVRALGRTSSAFLHLAIEAQKLAFADRAAYLADPAFVPQPTARLTGKDYAAQRRALIDPARAASSYPAGDVEPEQPSTTHVSVVDRRGGAVALTCTIEQEMGSAVVAPGTGILLNNELTDFGDPGTANEPAAGKRPRSSMAPTIVVDDGKPALVVGGAGGARIIEGVLLAVVGAIDFDLDPAATLQAPRVEGAGASVLVENGRLGPEVVPELEARGHRVTREGAYGVRPRVQAAGMRRDGDVWGASDPRTDQAALVERPAPE